MKETLRMRRETGRGKADAQESRGSRRARRGRLGFCSLGDLLGKRVTERFHYYVCTTTVPLNMFPLFNKTSQNPQNPHDTHKPRYSQNPQNIQNPNVICKNYSI